jgi:hypothetical protein
MVPEGAGSRDEQTTIRPARLSNRGQLREQVRLYFVGKGLHMAVTIE